MRWLALLVLAGWLAPTPVRATWFPVENGSPNPVPVHIILYVPGWLQPWLKLPSLETAAANLGHTLELRRPPALHQGMDDAGNLHVLMRVHDEAVEPGQPIQLANSLEDGSFWISWSGLQAAWDRQRHRFTDLSREQAIQNKLTFAVKHELFVHQIGLSIPTRHAIFRQDEYDLEGYLDSGSPVDSCYDVPTQLRPAHPYLLWRLAR